MACYCDFIMILCQRFEEEIKIARTCEVSTEKDDLPKVELSSLKNRFESNRDQKLITPETTGVPKRQARFNLFGLIYN